MPDPKVTIVAEMKDRASPGFDKLGKAGALAMAGLAASAAGAAVAATKMAANFDQAVREVATLTGGGAKDIARMKDEALELSAAMGTDATENVKALYQAISAGVSEDNAFTFLETAAQAAIGGVTDTATAVDGITTVINAWGLETDQASAVADSFFTTVKGGKTTFEELASRISNVAPIASAAGVSFQEVNAALQAMTKQGVPTAEATTQLRQIMAELQKPSKDLQESLDAVGISSGKAALEQHGLSGVLNILAGHASDTGQTLNQLFGSVEAGSGAILLAGKQSHLFTEALTAQGNAAGAAQSAYDTMADGATQSFARLRESVNKVVLGVGEHLLPAAQRLVDFFLQDEVPAVEDLEAAYKILHDEINKRPDIAGEIEDEVAALNEVAEAHLRIAKLMARQTELPSFIQWIKDAGAAIGEFAERGALMDDSRTRMGEVIDYLNRKLSDGVAPMQVYAEYVEIMQHRTDALSEQSLPSLSGRLGKIQQEYRNTSAAAQALVDAKKRLDLTTRRLGVSEAELAHITADTGRELDSLSDAHIQRLVPGVRAAIAASDDLEQELDQLAGQVDTTVAKTDSLTDSVSQLTEEQQRTEAKFRAVAVAARDVGVPFAIFRDYMDLSGQSAEQLRNALNLGLITLDSMKKELAATGKATKELADETETAAQRMAGYWKDFYAVIARNVENADAYLANAETQLNTFDAAANDAADELETFMETLYGVGTAAETTGTTVENVSTNLSGAATTAVNAMVDAHNTGSASYYQLASDAAIATSTMVTSLAESKTAFAEAEENYVRFQSALGSDDPGVDDVKATRFHEDQLLRQSRQEEDHAERIKKLQGQITGKTKAEQRRRIEGQITAANEAFEKMRRRRKQDLDLREVRLREDETRRKAKADKDQADKEQDIKDHWANVLGITIEELEKITAGMDVHVAEQQEKLGTLISDHVKKPVDDTIVAVDTLKGKIASAIDELKKLTIEGAKAASKKPEEVATGATALATGGASGVAGVATGPAPQPIAKYAEGGKVPGPVGAPQYAIVHGGEIILPPDVAYHSPRWWAWWRTWAGGDYQQQ